MSRLEEMKDILNSPGHVFFGDISDEGDVSQIVVDAEPHFQWLIHRVEELETKLSICESAVEEDQRVKERLSEENLSLWNSVKVLRRDKNKWYDVASRLQEDCRRYKQALNKIANEMDGNLEGLDAERGLEEAKEIAAEAMEDEK